MTLRDLLDPEPDPDLVVSVPPDKTPRELEELWLYENRRRNEWRAKRGLPPIPDRPRQFTPSWRNLWGHWV